ncbi:MAG: fibrobacter succinogenes major paralogous domain-containing protein [Fibrobacter sp.]|nr:fibrobacter succinogenes major paralogous domain-containing protein [Fibrobacter sp.]
MKRVNVVSFASPFLILPFMCVVACSVSLDSTEDDTNVPEVEFASELEECTDSLLGETVFVIEDRAYYTCIKEKWQKMEANNKSSSSKEGSSDSSDPGIQYGTLTDARDKRTYKTVTIGKQTWMAENLNYADSAATPSLKGNTWCYDNVSLNCDEKGRLYTWAAAIDSVKLANDKENPQVCGYDVECTLPAKIQGICPDGWRLPKDDDWKTLISTVNSSRMKSTKLKSTSGWSGNANGTNSSGFSVFPAGHRYSDGFFYNANIEASFWESEEPDSRSDHSEASCISFYTHFDDVLFSFGKKSYGFSVRCIEDLDSED